MTSRNVEYYRQRAAEARKLASVAIDTRSKALLAEIAADFDARGGRLEDPNGQARPA